MESSLVFSVRRREPVLVAPSEPTPHEFKNLSDIDDQESLRMQVPVIQYYRNDPSLRGKDPAKVIREALSRALVYYYPLAGRLREGARRKLVVECTGEGVLFIEADADVSLDKFGDQLHPPVPCLEELLYDIPCSAGIIDCPLILIQVTRLICGGFIFALRFNHVLLDANGILQFITTIAEMARGAAAPTVLPAWERELLNARTPPHATHVHQTYDDVPHPKGTMMPHIDLVQKSFFFSSKDILALKKNLPPHLHTSSPFEVLAAFFWRSCTAALLIDAEDEVRLIFPMDMRSRCKSYFPPGFYGNALVFPVVLSKAGDLHHNPLSYAVELIKRAKSTTTYESLRSVADLMVIKGRPPLATISMHHAYLVSDITKANFGLVDFGWGRAVHGGLATGYHEDVGMISSFYVSYRNSKGEEGVVVPLFLPRLAMERVMKEVEKMTERLRKEPHKNLPNNIRSAL